ncbi:hypothetical protein M409DRAFT_58108 [Zasmidium cellare ATCC 36951]|uniref:2EXR domain-containing protein n=1 Tax=Zasmidium cellare ATCC 36951 TaxID=1080233 RepID=A0A6A6C8W3_ZASCE|nr:uncharacterized protein M409DRAFT_58108 [Zasmidium cellare ATCC 36951]KAF2162698.1 hypothetical protein M409DRAFT_58108 [Zasmidium cellare ATCC 36951]
MAEPKNDAPVELPHRPFRLMDLPPELRLNIYEYALATPVCLDHQLQLKWNEDHKCSSMQADRIEAFPPLLQACRQIRLEAEQLWYATARFDYGASKMRQLKAIVGKGNTDKIRYSRLVGPWAFRVNAWGWISLMFATLQAKGYSGVLEAHVTEPGARGVVFAISAQTAYSYYEEV